jgi:hypothetical protein
MSVSTQVKSDNSPLALFGNEASIQVGNCRRLGQPYDYDQPLAECRLVRLASAYSGVSGKVVSASRAVPLAFSGCANPPHSHSDHYGTAQHVSGFCAHLVSGASL